MTLAAIVVSVAGLILTGGFVEDIFAQLGEAIIHSQSGHIQIAKKGFFVEGSRKPDAYFIPEPETVRSRVASLDGIDDVMVRLSFSGLLNNGRSDLSIVGEGIEPTREARMGTYLRLVAGRQLTAADANGILIGEGAAHALRLSPGDRVTLLASTSGGAANTLDFDVIGVFRSFSKDYDARTVKIPLAAAQELLDAQVANTLVVTLKDTGETDRLAVSIERVLSSRGLEVKRWQTLNDFYEKTVTLYDRQLGVLRVIVLFMVLLGVANAIRMNVFERTGELGTMRALGNRNSSLFSLLMTEGLIIGLIGSLAGVALGIVLAKLISLIGIPMPPPPNADMGYVAQIRVLPSGITTAFLVGLVATVAASIGPTLRALRVPVVDALRQNV